MNKLEKIRRGLGFDPACMGQLTVSVSATGSQAVPAPVIFPSTIHTTTTQCNSGSYLASS